MPRNPIRDAASIILIRDPGSAPAVLMGQRGASAAFMPNKFVFPGGALDTSDRLVSLAAPLGATCAARLAQMSDPATAAALPATVIRELWEETGLILGDPGEWTPPSGWESFAATGNRPSGKALSFVFRAITPPGRPRRFDARFFLADATAIRGDVDDFSAASDELSHLQWIPLAKVRGFDLPFITQVVLAEVARDPGRLGPPEAVPFFKNDDAASLFLRLGETA